MIHALRRVSFSTCLSDLFAFAARDPGKPLDKQFCHVFRTNQVRTSFFLFFYFYFFSRPKRLILKLGLPLAVLIRCRDHVTTWVVRRGETVVLRYAPCRQTAADRTRAWVCVAYKAAQRVGPNILEQITHEYTQTVVQSVEQPEQRRHTDTFTITITTMGKS